jgi:hypothetical protein
MEKSEKFDKIVNEMRELLKEKEILKEIKNQKKLLKEKERLKEIKEREFLKGLKFRKNKGYFEKVGFDIPYFIRDVEYEDITTLRAKKNYLQKCKEFALLNDVPIILVVNFLLLYLWRKM